MPADSPGCRLAPWSHVLRISARLLILEIVAFLAFVVMAGAGLLAWRLSQGPIDLGFIKPQVERSLAEARGGQPVQIEKLDLEWVRDRGRVEAVARGFTAMDKGGQITFRADRAMIALDAGSLFAMKVKARHLRLEKGTATVVRSDEGVWTLADMVIAQEPDASDKPFDPIRDIDWKTLATPIRALISAGAFEQVELVDFRLDVDDRKAGNVWSAEPVAGMWKANSNDGVSLNLSITLADAIAGSPNLINIALASDGKVERAAGKVTVEGVDPVLVAKMFGYTGDAFTSGRPASAAVSVTATERSGLLSTSLSLAGVTGSVKVADKAMAVRDLAFDAAYDPASKKVTLTSLTVDSDWVKGAFSGELDAAAIMRGEQGVATPFKLSGLDVTLDIRPVFEKAWQIDTAVLEGALLLDQSKISFSKVEAVTGKLNASASGDVWVDTKSEFFRVGVKGKALGTGQITPAQVLEFWPAGLNPATRDWVRERILAGVATKAVFSIDWPPGADSKGFLPDEHLSLEFDVQDASVKFLTDFPPITGVTGVGRLEGNSLTFDATQGAMGSWSVGEASVMIPQFAPAGAMMDITLDGAGQLGDLLRVVEASQFGFATRYGLDVSQVAGGGSVAISLQIPIKDEVLPEEVIYSIKGGFQQVVLPRLLGEFGLNDTNLAINLDNAGMTALGGVNFGPAPVTFTWLEKITTAGSSGVELTARARATPDLLNAFGLAARNVMQGEAAVELKATGPGGRDFDAITARVDLRHTQLDLAELGWRKDYDAPATGTFRYGADTSGSVVVGDIKAAGLQLTGEARMARDGVVQAVDVERIFSQGTVDLGGTAQRRSDGGYRVSLNGPFFDASPWMDSILDMSGGDEAQDAVGGPADPGPVFDVQLNANRLKLRAAEELTNARISLQMDADGPRSGKITGDIARNKKLDVTIGTTGSVRNIVMLSDDAGFAARVLLKADYLLGGKMMFDGKFEGPKGDALVTMSNVRLKDAPLVAQLFSLASLQGLADVLSGEGVLFTDVYAPVKLVDGRIDLPGMRATGPAMGLTARGWIAPEAGNLSLDGTLAPSFIGANAVLGALPVIGDLFVSRQGEGMFAPTYSVRGTFARANISINPVAALTPGVLRRIFENPAEPPPTDGAGE
jgi:hypothetical protein